MAAGPVITPTGLTPPAVDPDAPSTPPGAGLARVPTPLAIVPGPVGLPVLLVASEEGNSDISSAGVAGDALASREPIGPASEAGEDGAPVVVGARRATAPVLAVVAAATAACSSGCGAGAGVASGDAESAAGRVAVRGWGGDMMGDGMVADEVEGDVVIPLVGTAVGTAGGTEGAELADSAIRVASWASTVPPAGA